MKLFDSAGATVTYLASLLAVSPCPPESGASQGQGPTKNVSDIGYGHPVFRPPGAPENGANFTCDYRAMKEWYFCSTPNDRGCWLRHPNGSEFNIHTNYETETPIGIDRYYDLDITDGWLNPDGVNSTEAKLFNNMYPGPWIEACWGDRIIINVTNHMKHNGTSIHWHGIRQLNSMHMDGVNGVTQCPIAPGDHFQYIIDTTQYGTSWYHSHYAVQYADGLQGPFTIHGPISANFDNSKDPLILTDWGHNSAFDSVYDQILESPSILLNGIGNVTRFNSSNKAQLKVPDIYQLEFEQVQHKDPKKYLLRIINTSFESTFVFSIDNHWLQMVSADFVPITPYSNTSLLVGIGQRYNVIVEARPEHGSVNPLPKDGNFWIRTWIPDVCSIQGHTDGYEQNGILRYDASSKADPHSLPWPGVSIQCSDEAASSLQPIVPWSVGQSSNTHDGQLFGVNFNDTLATPAFPLAQVAFDMSQSSGFTPLQINFSDPIFLHLDEAGGSWPKQWAVIPENYKADDWVYIVLTGNGSSAGGASTTFGAHPIHLHGHDFAILAQVENHEYPGDLSKFKLNTRNPARRDVALLPSDGYLVIAFKTDNPGSWLLHCHIAYHASYGLAFQILERRADTNHMFPHGGSPAIAEAERVCGNWDKWHGDCKNWWPGLDATTQTYPACEKEPGVAGPKFPHVFQDDSGI
ncbi:multicopper oxidase-domain-containing protein [Microdochium bolleyi]|uniref:Multicopper oxidase-domain-containing protein n=1 Tax=Microdochium bolleyi TaxID=196109 RepID=A0A136J921_9PEZI|nr:multicopper oxidase-domain-containing protein [Microdochium bolleyi]